MSIFKDSKKINSALSIALIAIMAATIECGKVALSFLPNIEVVTLLCALYGYVFGWYGVVASVLFVCIEPLVWGVGSWILTYFLYWPLVAIVFMILGAVGLKNRWLITVIAVGLTLFFGVLSSLVDCALMLGINEYYLANFAIYYARGSVFYALQTLCNAILFPVLFLYLSEKLGKIKTNLKC